MQTIAIARLSRFWLTALALASLVFMVQVAGSARPAEALTNCNVSDMTFDAQEQEFLRLINNYRAQNGLGTLTASVNLNRAASWHAADMATKRYFSHTDSLGRSPSKRVSDCGGLQNVGENIAAGTTRDSAQAAFTAWRNSDGHNRNMLNGSYRQIGIARYYDASSPYRWYWVTVFSTSNDGTNASTGSGGGTGGGTVSPSPTPAPTAAAAQITSPTPGSTLGTSATFRWTAVQGAQAYHMYIGTSLGASNMLSANLGTSTSVTVNGFPRNGSTIYVRLWTQTAAGWQYNDYTYRLSR